MGRVIRVNFRHSELLGRVAQNVPATMLRLPIWLLYGSNKVPLYTDGTKRRGKLDSPIDRGRLVSFDVAAAAISGIGDASGLGIALGDVPGQNIRICGIDLDHCFNGELLDERAEAVMQGAESYSERSPSGDGLHILGVGNAGTFKSKHSGLEIYSGSRYFTVTGQVLRPAELANLEAASAIARCLYSDYVTQAMRERIPRGRRNNTLTSIAGRLRCDGLKTRELDCVIQLVNRRACKPTLDANEVSSIARSVGHYPSGGGSRKPEAGASPIKFTSIAEVVAQRRETEWLLPKILERRVLAVLAGKRSTFKSFISLDWSLRAALAGAGVVMLSAEGGGLDRRVDAWIQRHAPGTDLNSLKVQVLERSVNLNNAAQLQLLSDAIVALPWHVDLIDIDTMSKFSPGLEENSNTEVAAFLASVSENIRDRHGCTVLLVVHVGHGQEPRPRGASALMANPDAEFIVERTDAVSMTVTVTRERFKDSPAMPPLAYTAEVVDLGRVDCDGEPVSSLVLVAGNAPFARPRAGGINQMKAVSALHDWQSRHPDSLVISTLELNDLLKTHGIKRQRRPEVLKFLVNARILARSVGGYSVDKSLL